MTKRTVRPSAQTRFKTDGGGTAVSIEDCKIEKSETTWATNLSQLKKQVEQRVIIFASYIPDDLDYLANIVMKHPENLTIVAYKDNAKILSELKGEFPEVDCYLTSVPPTTMVLIEPRTVWIGSGVFGPYRDYAGFEPVIGIHDRKVFELICDDLRRWWDEEPNKHRPLITN